MTGDILCLYKRAGSELYLEIVPAQAYGHLVFDVLSDLLAVLVVVGNAECGQQEGTRAARKRECFAFNHQDIITRAGQTPAFLILGGFAAMYQIEFFLGTGYCCMCPSRNTIPEHLARIW